MLNNAGYLTPRTNPYVRALLQNARSANNGTTAGGLASVLGNLGAGMMQSQDRMAAEKDKADQLAAQKAFMQGMTPTGNPNMGPGQVPGSLSRVAQLLSGMGDNPHAGQIGQQVAMMSAQQQMEDQRAEQARLANQPKFETVQDPYGRGGVGQRNTLTGQIVDYQGPVTPDATTSQRDYEYAVQNGFDGSYMDFVNATRRSVEKLPTGYQPAEGGGLQPIPGGPADPARPGAKPVTSVGQDAVDREFGKTYVTDIAQGGLADAEKNLEQLRGVKSRLDAIVNGESDENLTGSVVGNVWDPINRVINPEAVDTREQVEEVVQRNLRVILGAQFTEKEGERLISRAYNPALDEKTNAARLGRLVKAMEGALEAKKAAASYFEENGTLAGYKGAMNFTVADFESVLDDAGGMGGGAMPEGIDPEDWKYMTPEERALFK